MAKRDFTTSRRERARTIAATLLLAALSLPAVADDRAAALSSSLPPALAEAQARFAEAWAEAPLAIARGLFVEGEVTGFGQYTPRPDATFAQDDTLIVYVQPVGYGYLESATGHAIRLTADFEVANASGQILAAQERFATLESDARDRQREFHATLRFRFDGLRPGAYTLTTRLSDTATGESASLDLPFTVTADPAPAE
ncbi:hypothetical protein [Stappia sp.]|uniref:hypothetical protein n=1 Tax=Stappia sp. TaxID=1870903 RepID=UPI0032D96918